MSETQMTEPTLTYEDLQQNVAVRNERILDLEKTLAASYRQFQFYADEHKKAGKTDKAKTNQDYADLCKSTLEKSIWTKQ